MPAMSILASSKPNYICKVLPLLSKVAILRDTVGKLCAKDALFLVTDLSSDLVPG